MVISNAHAQFFFSLGDNLFKSINISLRVCASRRKYSRFNYGENKTRTYVIRQNKYRKNICVVSFCQNAYDAGRRNIFYFCVYSTCAATKKALLWNFIFLLKKNMLFLCGQSNTHTSDDDDVPKNDRIFMRDNAHTDTDTIERRRKRVKRDELAKIDKCKY